ncbi:hypothetical protein SAMN05444392_11657 [Seinonella peptonophila]|uniref:Uncharacterized protein n=1 Tax=Seinonella peptonophila TaxID=112248 RepID=A0A1M5AXE9_9BACL|nr:hypothetical protein [Seinonella peptonophila]SHF34895.1 hypothetical protein SAMN05444392_11657 [Seinonella peptonophila]
MKHKQALIYIVFALLIGTLIWGFFYWTYSEDQLKEKQVSIPSDSMVASEKRYTKEDMKQSEKVAREFLIMYLKEKMELDQMKYLVTPYLYMQLQQMQKFHRKTAEVQLYQTVSINRGLSEMTENGMSWTFDVIEEITNAQSEKTTEEKFYTLQLIKEDRWQVDEVDAHGTFD